MHQRVIHDRTNRFRQQCPRASAAGLVHPLQVEAHHYCSCANEEVRQCVIYDSADSNARLIGIEYIISRRLFESLPEEEKKLWHSHTYEVRLSPMQKRTVLQPPPNNGVWAGRYVFSFIAIEAIMSHRQFQ